jgi:hypothetical protein
MKVGGKQRGGNHYREGTPWDAALETRGTCLVRHVSNGGNNEIWNWSSQLWENLYL